MNIIITVKTCMCLVFPLVYTQVCFNNPDGSISDSSVYNKEYFCCDHYEIKDEECIECKIGFTSSKGEHCKPCSPDTFGYRCTESCLSCAKYERCDHIRGCTSQSTTIFNSSELRGTFPIDQTPTQTETQFGNKDESSVQNLYTYIYGGGGVFGFILLCTIFFKIRSYKSTKVVISQDLETNAAETGFESVYEDIDEADLDEIIQQSNLHTFNVDETSTSSSSTDKNSASNCDDYLNPYQSILQHTENHEYRSISNVVSDSSIGRCEDQSIRVDICNPINYTVEKGERILISTDDSKCIDLKYSDLEIDTQNGDNGLNRYENTRIFQTKRKRTSQTGAKCNTEYAEIIHTLV